MRLIMLLFLISLSTTVFGDDCYRDGQDIVCSKTSEDGKIVTNRYYLPEDNSNNIKRTSPNENTTPTEVHCKNVIWGILGTVCITQ